VIYDILSFPLWIISSPDGGIFVKAFIKSLFIVSLSFWFVVEWKLSKTDRNTYDHEE
jgi:hypothetical protein